MADYWKSNPRKYCEVCQCWLADNKISVQNHETGNRHKANVAKKVNEIEKKSRDVSREQKNLQNTIQRLNDGAFVGMMKDISRDPSLAKRYGIVLTEEAQKQVEERVAADSKASTTKAQPTTSKKLPTTTVACPWREATSQNSTKYYWNIETGATQWERPEGFSFIPEAKESVKHEKDRLQQFVFNRLVELSESGSEGANVAVHKAFNAPLPQESSKNTHSSIVTDKKVKRSSSPPTSVPKFEGPKVDLLGKWVPVKDDPPAKLPKLDLPQDKVRRARKPDGPLTQADEEKHHAAGVLAHLGETTDDAIRNSSVLPVGEKQIAPGALSQPEPSNTPRIVFRRGPTAGSSRNFRTSACTD